MKRLLLASIVLIPIQLFGQTKEFGFHLGGANYIGDLAPSIAFKETHQFASLFYRHNNGSGFFSWKYALCYGEISGNDQNFAANAVRNLNFRSTLLEASVQLEFNFRKFFIGLRSHKFSPYVFAGLGGVYFNPQGSLNNKWYALRPLSTEGEGLGGAKSYSNFTLVIPYGMGVKWVLAPRWNLAINAGFRYTFTDYLDDVSGTYFDKATLYEMKGQLAVQMADKSLNQYGSAQKQRGNPDRNDWYVFSGISISYWLLDRNCFNFK
ncbi:hypothetical protein GC194_02300 [bacterium]|nr:hypothetical protein [bacterium]